MLNFKGTISTRKALAMVLTAIALTAIITYVFAATPSTTFMISGGIYPGAPSYTIWREGSYYFAKNSNGEIEFSGTDAATVKQAAINALTNGGIIFIKNAIYPLSSYLTMKDNIHIIGESKEKTVLDTSNTGAYIKAQNIESFSIQNVYVKAENNQAYQISISDCDNFTLRDLKIYTNATSYGYGIYLDSCNYVYCNNIELSTSGTGICLVNCNEIKITDITGIRQKNSANDVIRLEGCYDATINNIVIDGDATSDGIYRGVFIKSSQGVVMSNAVITKTKDAAVALSNSSYVVISNVIGSYVTTSCSGLWARNITHVTITDSQFNFNIYDGILIGEEQTADEVSEYIIISNVQTISNNQVGGQRCGIRLINGTGTTRRVIIENCVVGDNQGTPTQYDGIQTVGSAGENIIKNNMVFNNTHLQINSHASDDVSGNMEFS